MTIENHDLVEKVEKDDGESESKSLKTKIKNFFRSLKYKEIFINNFGFQLLESVGLEHSVNYLKTACKKNSQFYEGTRRKVKLFNKALTEIMLHEKGLTDEMKFVEKLKKLIQTEKDKKERKEQKQRERTKNLDSLSDWLENANLEDFVLEETKNKEKPLNENLSREQVGEKETAKPLSSGKEKNL